MTLLSLFAEEVYNLPLLDLLGTSIAILGMTGSGKSNTTARLTEQLLTAGVPVVVVDIAGEHYGLKERFPLIVAGKSANIDIELASPAQAAALARWSLETGTSIVLDLRDYRRVDRMPYVVAYLEAIWDAAGQWRRPYHIILEEAHNYIPQSGTSDASDIVTTIATEGRKQGLGIVMLSQRPARIDKDVLSQASIRLLHRVFDANDIKAYQAVMSESPAQVKSTVTTLNTGQAMLVYPAKNICVPVTVLKRETFHGGFTPGMDTVQPPQLTGVAMDMLDGLKDLLAGVKEDTSGNDRVSQLEAMLNGRDARIDELEMEVRQLREENAMLAKLVVTMPDGVAVVAENNGAAVPVQWAFDVPAEDADYRSELATTRAIRKQQREFEALLRDIQQALPMHRRMLRYLLEHTDLELTRRQLARYLGYMEKTLSDRPPTLMLQRGIIQRRVARNQQLYSAGKTEKKLAEMFPDLRSDLVQVVVQACGKL